MSLDLKKSYSKHLKEEQEEVEKVENQELIHSFCWESIDFEEEYVVAEAKQQEVYSVSFDQNNPPDDSLYYSHNPSADAAVGCYCYHKDKTVLETDPDEEDVVASVVASDELNKDSH